MSTIETVSYLPQIITTAIAILITFIAPLILVMIFTLKYKKPFKPILVGALTFILFALVLEQGCHYLFLTLEGPISSFLLSTPVFYILYACFAAGIFEESGRFLAFKIFFTKKTEPSDSYLYGLGHGGIESILVVGLSMISVLTLFITLQSTGLEQYLSLIPEASQAQVAATIQSLVDQPAYLFLVSALERISAVMLHLSLSVLVYFSVFEMKRIYLYPLVIVFHAFADLPAVLYQQGILTNLFIVESWVLLFSLVLVFFSYRYYHKPHQLIYSNTVDSI